MGILRIQIPDRDQFYRLILLFVKNEYKIRLVDDNGDCFYVWIPEKRVEITMRDPDAQILRIEKNDFNWLLEIF